MKMRLKPLRGQTYEIEGKEYLFIEPVKDPHSPLVKIYNKYTGGLTIVDIKILNLPIIDTNDYEKIEDTKYIGD